MEISIEPHSSFAQKLIGVRGGARSRQIVADAFGDELDQGSPLYLLLDDFAGASLVAGWAWSQWVDDWEKLMRDQGGLKMAGRKGAMTGVCTGFKPGSTGLDENGEARLDAQSGGCEVPDLTRPGDPMGWHTLDAQKNVSMRRARRMDVWRKGDLICADIGFQDSCPTPQGKRMAVHEYVVTLSADAKTFALRSIAPQPHILPLVECPNAVENVQRLIGENLGHMRMAVLDTLPGVLGCTHLNDVLRSAADIPRLVKALETA